MAGAQRFVIALVTGVLFLSSLPFTSADTNSDNGLSLEISSTYDEKTFLEGEILRIESILANYGDSTIFQENPACEVYFEVKTENNLTVFSNLEQCRDQTRNSIISNSQIIEQDDQFWDFKNFNGNYVDSGKYTINLHHSKMELRDSVVVAFLKKTDIDENIDIKLTVNQVSTTNSQKSYIAQVTLINRGIEIIDLEGMECMILVSNVDFNTEIESCFSETKLFHPNENIYSGHIIITEKEYDYSQPIQFQLYGLDKLYSAHINEDPQQNSHPESDNSSLHDEYDSSNISIRNVPHQTKVQIIAQSTYQNFKQLSNLCDGSVTIFNDYGELIHSESLTECESQIPASTGNEVNIIEWEIIDDQQCYIPVGTYTIVVEIQNSLFSTEFYQNEKNRNLTCQFIDYHVDFQSTFANNSIYSSINIKPTTDVLRIDADCIAGVKVYGSLGDEIIDYLCGFHIGNYFTLEGESIEFASEINLNGDYSNHNLEVRLSAFMGHTKTITKHIKNNDFTSNVQNYLEIEGTWQNIEHGLNNCWIINSPNSAFIVDSKQINSAWRPKEGWSGTYKATTNSEGSVDCGIFGLQMVEINEIYIESEPISITEFEISEVAQSNEIDVVAITITGTASASILVTLVLLISNTETMRIPLTSAGLWMLALVGKTHETSDGRFQRGRLIGYLTANPGCHFRALMAALNMSNGQITHHLRLLENQELIWRINDGRFVRYYPLNNSLYPGMNPDDLPVPPLSPDPKSLQGKILTLLDDEHQIGEFPTQSELAKKLEKSQQLISHHLRTLQKYGLVEKRKMGIKNRYKLTKEALFLLETDIDYNKIRD